MFGRFQFAEFRKLLSRCERWSWIRWNRLSVLKMRNASERASWGRASERSPSLARRKFQKVPLALARSVQNFENVCSLARRSLAGFSRLFFPKFLNRAPLFNWKFESLRFSKTNFKMKKRIRKSRNLFSDVIFCRQLLIPGFLFEFGQECLFFQILFRNNVGRTVKKTEAG